VLERGGRVRAGEAGRVDEGWPGKTCQVGLGSPGVARPGPGGLGGVRVVGLSRADEQWRAAGKSGGAGLARGGTGGRGKSG